MAVDTDDNLPSGVRTEAEFGEWLHGRLIEEYGNETEAWATERVERITERLNRVRRACPVPGACPHDIQTEILWIGAMTAFAAPGRYIYITRELLQQADSDEPFALVLAHEMAHHDLGHTRLLAGALNSLRYTRAFSAGAFLTGLGRCLLSPENESAADSYALDLCVAAGFDAKRCLELFTILEAYLVDHRDLEGVFGSDESLAGSLDNTGTAAQAWLRSARGWMWHRLRGYPSIRERSAALTAQLRVYAGPPLPISIDG